eukprot:Gregarina_sp_Pseudo_9__5151@NODE_548_length_2597_cov_19_552776_g518_i0_p1_GENE_NODE_548_length_2597_cov_19_552776_g518_i0NODE_548_length_2597_cov_19_552776_g518_i0_p1_ORF_typecomplete_len423_score116_05PCI/PF01399_27/1_7e03PCI/PF01399_27/5_1e09Herpes_U34/PF04541_13/0_0019DUF742/PF05331_11/4_6e03DUF742/PF05331_11/0_55_NODE_548_length_2597_cov_19_552776_g518_i0631331
MLERDAAIAAIVTNTPAFETLLTLPSPLDDRLENIVSTTEQLAAETRRNPSKRHLLQDIEECLKKRLHHQFIELSEEYLFGDAGVWEAEPNDRVSFALCVIKPCMGKLNVLTVLGMLRRICDTCKGLSALKFLEFFRGSMAQSMETAILFKALQAFHLLHGGFVIECEDYLFEHIEPALSKSYGLPGSVQSEFHRAAAAYHWRTHNLDEFYKHGMFYLHGTDLNRMLQSDKVELAQNLCKAVILSKTQYSFTELLQHEILKVISPGGAAYPAQGLLRDCLVICNSGDHQMLQAFVEERKAQLQAAGLMEDLELIQNKTTVFSLLELAFMKPQKSRVLTFAEISETCKVPMNQIEILVMKVMSHGLLKGSIDAIDQTVSFTTLQPRLLDDHKIAALSQQFRSWSLQVTELVEHLEKMGSSLLV